MSRLKEYFISDDHDQNVLLQSFVNLTNKSLQSLGQRSKTIEIKKIQEALIEPHFIV